MEAYTFNVGPWESLDKLTGSSSAVGREDAFIHYLHLSVKREKIRSENILYALRPELLKTYAVFEIGTP